MLLYYFIRMKTILLRVSILFLISGCVQSGKVVSDAKELAVNTVKVDDKVSSLSWSGTYEGVLPCADCAGIKTEITLNKDSSFLKKTAYLGKDSTVFEEKGIIKWDTDGKIVTLDDSSRYFIGTNNLSQLNADGSKVLGALSEKYILKKIIY